LEVGTVELVVVMAVMAVLAVAAMTAGADSRPRIDDEPRRAI
jgi:type II secretory pathway pseudopilin PulG